MSTLNYRGLTVDVTDHPRTEHWRPNERQVKNLIDLVDVVRRAPPPKFRMDGWGEIDDMDPLRQHINPRYIRYNSQYRPEPRLMAEIGKLDRKVAHECGTAACAAGTGAFYGIGVTKNNGGDWNEYVQDAYDAYPSYPKTNFMFGADHPNSAEAAARRILWYLHEGQGKDAIDKDWAGSTITKKIKRYGEVVVLPKE